MGIQATKINMQLNMVQQTDSEEVNLCTFQCLVTDTTLKDIISKKKMGHITFLLPSEDLDDKKPY